jgi:uncharacterized protein (DUF2236 family)
MSCPVADNDPTEVLWATRDGVASSSTEVWPPVVQRFERVAGSVFSPLFAAALFDQTMFPSVSAALEATGRIANQPWQRAIRTGMSEQLIIFAAEPERLRETERLRDLHRDVRGVGADGTRYSAFEPESWNWIMISTFFGQRAAYQAITGEHLSAGDNQAIWAWYRHMVEPLQLPGRARLVESYDELASYYDTMAVNTLKATPTLHAATTHILHAPRPDFLPSAAEPVWRLIAPALGEVAAVLGFGSMHPGVRALVPMRWTRRHDLEYRALTALVRIAYRTLPPSLTDTPLARNRRQYRRLITKYRTAELTSFAPDH